MRCLGRLGPVAAALVRLPKVGDEVRLEWIDSGKESHGTFEDAVKEELVTSTVYGQVCAVDDKRILIAMDRSPNNERSTWAQIWTGSVIRWTRLRG